MADDSPQADWPEPLIAAAREHHVYQAQALKAWARNGRGREAAYARYRQALGPIAGSGLVARGLSGMHDFARAHAASYELQAPGGVPFSVAPPRVIGEGNERALHAVSRASWVARFDGVRVRSRSSALEVDDQLLIDAEPGELDSIDDRIDLDPAVFDVANGVAWVIEPGPAAQRFCIPEAFHLLGAHSWAFGHWMWEFLPRYVAASESASVAGLPVLVDAGMPPQHLQSLQALLPAGGQVVALPTGAVASVDRLWCAPTPMYMPMYEHMNARFRWDLLAAEPVRFSALVRRMKHMLGVHPAQGASGRVFFARRPFRHRCMRNAAEIEAIARKRGFEVVHPEDLDFATQLAIVAGAGHIAGPEGSAMFLALLAPPGARVTILNHPYTLGLPVLTGLLEALGLEVEVLVGPALSTHAELPHFVDYEIDGATFDAMLAAPRA